MINIAGGRERRHLAKHSAHAAGGMIAESNRRHAERVYQVEGKVEGGRRRRFAAAWWFWSSEDCQAISSVELRNEAQGNVTHRSIP